MKALISLFIHIKFSKFSCDKYQNKLEKEYQIKNFIDN